MKTFKELLYKFCEEANIILNNEAILTLNHIADRLDDIESDVATHESQLRFNDIDEIQSDIDDLKNRVDELEDKGENK